VVTLDHRGHGAGIRSPRVFRLADCADDAVALLDVLGLDRVVVAGYSMGGAVAQLLARRHPDRVEGIVLAATASRFSGTAIERRNFVLLAAIAVLSRLAPRTTHERIVQRLVARGARGRDGWILEELLRNDWRSVLEAGHALGTFDATPWLGELGVPASVILTTGDSVVPLQRQLRMLSALRDARAFVVDGDHDGCVRHADLFVPQLVAAVASVLSRARRPSPPGSGG
jgi:3-oxoadipate enol-lactonase